jgi:hypothetical protein
MAAEELPKDFAHSCCVLHSWFILRVLMLHSAMKTYWITAEITRWAFLNIEAKSKDEARAMAEQLLEEGAFEGWEEDLPDVIVEEIPEELTT